MGKYISLWIDEKLLNDLDKVTKIEDRSRNNYIIHLISQNLKKLRK